MNKKEIMRQTSLGVLLREMVKHQPGIASNRLFETAKEWAGTGRWDHRDTLDFEAELAKMNGAGFRVTNKQWYEVGHISEPKRKGPSKDDPRQTRMFG